jgi:hypothetical protein
MTAINSTEVLNVVGVAAPKKCLKDLSLQHIAAIDYL